MYVVIYSAGGGVSLAGDFRANFDVLSNTPPKAILQDTTVQLAGYPITLHASEYNETEKRFVLPFTLDAGTLDGTNLSPSMLILLGLTSDQVSLASIERDFPLPLETPLLILLCLILLYTFIKR